MKKFTDEDVAKLSVELEMLSQEERTKRVAEELNDVLGKYIATGLVAVGVCSWIENNLQGSGTHVHTFSMSASSISIARELAGEWHLTGKSSRASSDRLFAQAWDYMEMIPAFCDEVRKQRSATLKMAETYYNRKIGEEQ